MVDIKDVRDLFDIPSGKADDQVDDMMSEGAVEVAKTETFEQRTEELSKMILSGESSSDKHVAKIEVKEPVKEAKHDRITDDIFDDEVLGISSPSPKHPDYVDDELLGVVSSVVEKAKEKVVETPEETLFEEDDVLEPKATPEVKKEIKEEPVSEEKEVEKILENPADFVRKSETYADNKIAQEAVEQNREEHKEEDVHACTDIVESNDLPDGDYDWAVKSPAPMYKAFYEAKVDIIKTCCVDNEQIPFREWRKELRECSVDVSVLTFDPKEIHVKMQKVTNLRERLQEIRIQTNTQYFLWKRGIVLLRGSISRIEHDKPVIKQEGVFYEHMSDVEMYFAELEALHDAAEIVDKTLCGAFDCLSRQVSIALPLKSMDRYGSPYEPPPQSQPSEEIAEYDGLIDRKVSPVTLHMKQDDDDFLTSAGAKTIDFSQIPDKKKRR